MTSIIGNYSKAKRLVGKPRSSLYLMTQVLHVPLPCEYLADIKGAMMLLLKEELEIYSPELQGVPVAFNEKSARMLESSGSVISAQSYTHCNLQSEFVVFKPKLGDLLDCVVNKVTPNSFGCLIHDCFYATVHRKGNEGETQKNIKLWKKICLKVVKLEEDGNGVLSITGEISGKEQRQKKNNPQPLQTGLTWNADDSGIENSDIVGSITPAHDADELNSKTLNLTEATDQSDHERLHSDSLLSPMRTKSESESKIYRNPESIKDVTETTCFTVGIKVDQSSNEGVIMSLDEDSKDSVRKKLKKAKKEKKHKKKHKKEKEAKRNRGKTEFTEPNDSTPFSGQPTGGDPFVKAILQPNSGIESSKTSSLNSDLLSSLTATDFFSPARKKPVKKETVTPSLNNEQSGNDATRKKSKNSSRKRKQGVHADFTSPPQKRLALETSSNLLPDSLLPSNTMVSTPSKASADEMSEHEQQAIFHLKKLGINLPLSLLKSGVLSSPGSFADPNISNGRSGEVVKSAISREHSEMCLGDKIRPDSTRLEQSRDTSSLMPTVSDSDETPHLENVSSFLKTEECVVSSPGVKKTHKKRKRTGHPKLKGVESGDGLDSFTASRMSYDINSGHQQPSNLRVGVDISQAQSKKDKKKKHKEKKRKKS